MTTPLSVLIVGAGMYVCGRGTTSFGTVLPGILEWAKTRPLKQVVIAGNSRNGIRACRAKAAALKRLLGSTVAIEYLHAPQTYRDALTRLRHPSCAIIAVPDREHAAVASFCLKNRIPALVVKPLVPTVKEAQALLKLQEAARTYGCVEFHKRLDWANLKLKETIQTGRIGEPLYFLVEYSQKKSIPSVYFRKWAAETNIFQYLGVHYVDIIYWASAATPLRAIATGQKGYLYRQGIDTYDSVQALVEWRSVSGKRFVSSIAVNWIDPENSSAVSEQSIKVVGTKGRFESDQKRRGITLVTDGGGVEEPNPYFCARYDTDEGTAFRGYGIESVKQFLNDSCALAEGSTALDALERTRPTFTQSLVSTAIIEAVNTSLRRGGAWINIPKNP